METTVKGERFNRTSEEPEDRQDREAKMVTRIIREPTLYGPISEKN